MKHIGIALAVASLAESIGAHVLKPMYSRLASDLEVTLAPVEAGGAAELIATVKNVGSVDLNLLKVGTILDEVLPVQKVTAVNEAGIEAPFRGIHASIKYDALKLENFHLLKVLESVSTVISAATVHDFTESGTHTFSTTGLLPVAPAGSTQLSGPALIYQSNNISLYVDSKAAAAVPLALSSNPLEERTNVQDGCNATQLAASTAALANCETLALAAAADAADSSSARFVEYFKTNSSTTRQTVTDRLKAAAKECSTTDSGPSRYFCYDYYNLCETEGPLNAYTKFDFDFVIMCPLFYDTLPPLPQACHHQDQATTTIHEMTHCEDVFSPHTNDFVYGYNESSALPPEKALLNADNYSLYANAVYMKC
ncbi:Deuterolysin metalloprotease family-domain-containing protein [Hypoxylon trugodes]|uniref:Deuterolysin metalloprotease family-domain-containing protein n=1 Tax=Hypoxylon trugodes TaxID=326681 RepID=UPI00219ABE35|nr:Deuterolysin metalloprotease family-domain-containing protein [Hypoxylon trugodes]KAI1382930.1 Deuterolysin metalloprotease family-domain-containing protein [Hypoxylon trugodes]